MNILILSSYWPTSSNPISGVFVVQQISSLIDLGNNITLILENVIGRPKSAYLNAIELGLPSDSIHIIEVNVIRFPEKLSSISGVGLINTRVIGAFINKTIKKRVLNSEAFEGCIVHGLRYMGLSVSFWRGNIKGEVVIVTHGVDPFFNKLSNIKWASKVLIDSVNAYNFLILVGTPLLSHISSLKVPKKKVRIIPNGTEIIDQAFVSDKQRGCFDKRIVLSVSNLIELKGIDLNLLALAEIAQRLPHLLWEYHIVGDGPERERLIELANRLGISNKVRFFGRISYDETMRKINDADIFSLPSWGEAFGIVYLEAMMRMRPVIGCYENGAADIIIDGVNGLLIPPKNITTLAEKLEILLLSPDLCQKLGQEGRKTAEKFSWQRNAMEILKAIGID